jgi:hypothetical protein
MLWGTPRLSASGRRDRVRGQALATATRRARRFSPCRGFVRARGGQATTPAMSATQIWIGWSGEVERNRRGTVIPSRFDEAAASCRGGLKSPGGLTRDVVPWLPACAARRREDHRQVARLGWWCEQLGRVRSAIAIPRAKKWQRRVDAREVTASPRD